MRSFLKWAGSKYQLIEQIKRLLPDGKRLVEPFAGSGAVFVNTQYPRYFIGERNTDLVSLYTILQTEGLPFIEYCQSFYNEKNKTENKFYRFRALFNRTKDERLKAALFLYLNRHGYNGLCRYNLKGKFNVPYGYYKSPYFPKKEMIHFHNMSQNALIRSYDFRKTLAYARKGDVVYCDPPYIPLSNTSNFTQYSPHIFNEDDHIDLANCAKRLAKKGIPVLVSNHDTKFARTIYQDASIMKVKVKRSIGRQVVSKSSVSEILALFSN